MKKVLLFSAGFAVTFLTALLLFALPASAESGRWGELTWTFYSGRGELVISGNGDMDDWASQESDTWHTYASSIKSVKIEEGVTRIGKGAFYGCINLTQITIPSSVTSIGDAAFYSCSSLTEVHIPESVTEIAAKAFQDCRSLESMILPDSVTSIGNYAFSNCASMTSIMIPNSVTKIEMGAFLGCSSLTSITIPSSVKSLSYRLFGNCTALNEITLPASIRTINAQAVEGCTNLTVVKYWGTQAQWDEIIVGNGNEKILSALCIMGETTENDPPLGEPEKADDGKEDGCGSVVSGSFGMIALVALAGGLILSKKRKI